jgi:hypothetical protein
MYNDTTPIDLIEYLKPRLLNFVLHNFVAYWQKKKFKGFLKHILFWVSNIVASHLLWRMKLVIAYFSSDDIFAYVFYFDGGLINVNWSNVTYSC